MDEYQEMQAKIDAEMERGEALHRRMVELDAEEAEMDAEEAKMRRVRTMDAELGERMDASLADTEKASGLPFGANPECCVRWCPETGWRYPKQDGTCMEPTPVPTVPPTSPTASPTLVPTAKPTPEPPNCGSAHFTLVTKGKLCDRSGGQREEPGTPNYPTRKATDHESKLACAQACLGREDCSHFVWINMEGFRTCRTFSACTTMQPGFRGSVEYICASMPAVCCPCCLLT